MRHVITFEQSTQHSAHEFGNLQDLAISPELFALAVRRMTSEKWRADIDNGVTLKGAEVAAKYVGYDWGDEYKQYPNLVFHDFFKGPLMNYYSRLFRGVDTP